MKWCLYTIALTILVTGLIWAGVSASTLLAAGLVLAFLVAVFLMVRGLSDRPPAMRRR